VVDGSRLIRPKPPWAGTPKDLSHPQLEGRDHDIQPRVEKLVQRRSVVGRQDNMASRPGNPSHLSYCQLWLREPGNGTNCDHQVEGVFLKGQGIDIAHVQ